MTPTVTATGARTGGAEGRTGSGLLLAGATAAVSGVSVWVNSYGVHAIRSASVYTTAKNLVSAVLLVAVAGVVHLARRDARSARSARSAGSPVVPDVSGGRSRRAGVALGMAYVGAVGGGLAFVMFFNGLARTSATSAAFWRDTLVIWVAAMAVPILREKLLWWNVVAMGLLVAGEIVLAGGVGHLSADRGQLLVLGSSVLWGIEVVVVKKLLAGVDPQKIGALRMALGSVVLVGYLAVGGHLGLLGRLDLRQVMWVLLTGTLLALYVLSWMAALSRARAVDVTSILVASALITWLLQTLSGTGAAVSKPLGLVLIAVGAAAVALASARHVAGRSPGSTAAVGRLS